VIVFVYWTAGRIPAAIAALALVLTYQEAPLYIWLWGNLLAALAVARAAPDGRFQRVARAYRTVSFVVLGLALLPFLWQQVRFALYPQLESYGFNVVAALGQSRPNEAMYSEDVGYLKNGAVSADAAAVAAPIEADIVEEPAAAPPPMPSMYAGK